MIDLGKFLTILMLFEFGFTVLVVAMNQPYHEEDKFVMNDDGKKEEQGEHDRPGGLSMRLKSYCHM